MEDYVPLQSLVYVYNIGDKKIYIRSSVSVKLSDPQSEKITPLPISGISPQFSRSLDVESGASATNPVESGKQVMIIDNVTTPQGEDDETYARERIVEDLYNLRASYYSVKATVVKLDGKKETTTSVIYQDGKIIIL